MAIAALAVNAEEMYLYLPEKEAEYAKELEALAAEYGIQIQTGIINRRASRGGAFHHILTMAALADIFADSYERVLTWQSAKMERWVSFRKYLLVQKWLNW